VRTAGPEYSVPLGRLLDDYADGEYWVIDAETEKAAETLKHTLEEFNIQAEVTGIRKGPVITMFEILPAPGVKLSKIVNLADNIALRLASSRVRIVAPIPGKHAVGIEVPNRRRAIVSFKEMIASGDFNRDKMEIPVVLGKDIAGNAQIIDLVQTPHLLIAGATGSGKSVCVNSLICSVLSCRRPDEVRMILIDPKIVELKLYNDIPHLLTPVVTEPKKAFQALQYCIYEMERRYALLDAMGVRDIRSYNKRIKDRRLAQSPLPYILIIVDEFADLMATTGKELESTLARLAAMSRAVGIHLVLATQRPSIDVITGLIKANIPSRIAFMVASKFDSRIIIDAVGAEKLLGRGDMLFTSSQNPFPTRIQGAFLSEDEVERVTDHVKTLGDPEYIDDEIFIDDDEDEEFKLMSDDGSDPMLDKALDIVIGAGKASASYLQRRLKIGYNRAARIVEDLEERGIVGPQQGSKPREVLHIPDRVKE
jgi:S-DNA-T family DNA segregation ATPase FtsK/SpoIIIE